MSQVSAKIVAAYRAARYEVDLAAGATVTLRVGEAAPAADRLMQEAGAHEAAFITAYNPASAPLCEAENRAAHENLLGELRRRGLGHRPARGVDPAGEWPDEPGVLVLAVGRSQATEIARQFDQNGFVHISVGAPAELILVR